MKSNIPGLYRYPEQGTQGDTSYDRSKHQQPRCAAPATVRCNRLERYGNGNGRRAVYKQSDPMTKQSDQQENSVGASANVHISTTMAVSQRRGLAGTSFTGKWSRQPGASPVVS